MGDEPSDNPIDVMPLFFTDTDGEEGYIADDLSVEYDGTEAVEEAVEDIVDALKSDGDVTNALIAELPGKARIREIRRADLGSKRDGE